MTTKPSRISLSKAQRQTAIGVELIALCQAVTADGRLNKVEIQELVRWLKEHRRSELPAIEFLVTTVSRIIADGIVTAEERSELHKALEKVLPPDLRPQAMQARKSEEKSRKEAKKTERLRQKEAERAERQRSRPLKSANFMIAGVHYEGRGERIQMHVREGMPVKLIREPHNAYSSNAIRIYLEAGVELGFVPEEYACEMAPIMDRGSRQDAVVTKVLTAGRVPIPVVQAYLYRLDADLPSRTWSISAAELQMPLVRELKAKPAPGILTRLARLLGF